MIPALEGSYSWIIPCSWVCADLVTCFWQIEYVKSYDVSFLRLVSKGLWLLSWVPTCTLSLAHFLRRKSAAKQWTAHRTRNNQDLRTSKSPWGAESSQHPCAWVCKWSTKELQYYSPFCMGAEKNSVRGKVMDKNWFTCEASGPNWWARGCCAPKTSWATVL